MRDPFFLQCHHLDLVARLGFHVFTPFPIVHSIFFRVRVASSCQDKDELFETMAPCLLTSVDRDALSGWGGVVHIITPEGIMSKTLKGRQD